MTDELNKTQIAVLIKLALEYNAAIIAQASLVYGTDLTPENSKKAVAAFRQMGKEYQYLFDTLIGGIENDNN